MAEAGRAAAAASRSNQSSFERGLTSRVARTLAGAGVRKTRRRATEWRRRLRREPHRVRYFHQVDDPYSHLAAQALGALAVSYDIEVEVHLVGENRGPNTPEPALLAGWALRDAGSVAGPYGLAFPASPQRPGPDAVSTGQRILAAAPRGAGFGERAAAVGEALFGGDKDRLQALAGDFGMADEARTQAALAEGDALRTKLRHYSGAMFHYGGEWYWGVDRLHHLETRLRALGAVRSDGPGTEVCPRPAIDLGGARDTGTITFEIYPSLRSPYTAVIFETAVALAREAGVKLVTRPVLPMVMRGVPATFVKGLYIFSDAQREAEHLQLPYGAFYDPIGAPVRRGYSLWPWAQAQGKGEALLTSFLRRAFYDAVDTGSDAGMRRVVEGADLSWEEARPHLDQPGWEEELEANRVTMYEDLGLWGVPAFRILGPGDEPPCWAWGQDRLWLMAAELRRRIEAGAGG